ncbi:MAG: cation diffusion facilitator family transporter [Anaeroplasmataceae bacterium]
MINILRRIFIKNYKDVKNERVRVAHATLSSVVGIILNIILASIKLFAGILSGSISIIADGINNMSDMGSSVVNLVGFKLSSKPADDDHPYGHERIEYIIGIIISVIILVVGGELLYNSVFKIIKPTGMEISLLVIIILSISIVIKLFMAFFYYRIGGLIDSVSIKAAAVDSRNDCVTTLAVLIGSIIFYFTDFIYIDGIVGILVSIFIIISGVGLVKESASPLIGEGLNKDELMAVITDIKNYDIVLGVHDIACHLYGPSKTFMSLHVEVPAKMNVLDIHEAIDLIEQEISQKYKIDVVIHMDPIENDNPRVKELKEIVTNSMAMIDDRLYIHDFRIVEKSNGENVIFDVIKPRDLKMTDVDITSKLIELTRDKGNFNYVIHYEYGYVDIKETLK